MTRLTRTRLWLGAAVAFALSVALFAFYWPVAGGPFWLQVSLTVLFALAQGVFFTAFPVVLVMGALKLREQHLREVPAMLDDNTVTADPEGPRKLHEYLTAITSTEARIGLLQRSEPYPGDKPQS